MSSYDGQYPVLIFPYQIITGANAIRCDNGSGGSPVTVTIPPGAYICGLSAHASAIGGVSSFQAALNAALQSAFNTIYSSTDDQFFVDYRLDGRYRLRNMRPGFPIRVLWASVLTTLPPWAHGFFADSSAAAVILGVSGGAMAGGQWHAGEPPMRWGAELERLVTRQTRTYEGLPIYLPHTMPGAVPPKARLIQWSPIPSARILSDRARLEQYRAAAGWTTTLGWAAGSGVGAGEGQNHSTLDRMFRYVAGHSPFDGAVGAVEFPAQNNRPVHLFETAVPFGTAGDSSDWGVSGPYYLDLEACSPGGLLGVGVDDTDGRYSTEHYGVRLVLWRAGA